MSNELNVADEAKNQWYHHWIRQGFQAFDEMREQQGISGSYSIGEELSLADACLIPQIYNAHRFNFPMDEFPRLQAINDKCLELERFQNAGTRKSARCGKLTD